MWCRRRRRRPAAPVPVELRGKVVAHVREDRDGWEVHMLDGGPVTVCETLGAARVVAMAQAALANLQRLDTEPDAGALVRLRADGYFDVTLPSEGGRVARVVTAEDAAVVAEAEVIRMDIDAQLGGRGHDKVASARTDGASLGVSNGCTPGDAGRGPARGRR